MTKIFLIIIILIVFIVLSVQYLARHVYKYKIKETCLEIALFGRLPLKRIYFNNIRKISETSFRESLPFKNAGMGRIWTFENRLWGKLVAITVESGFFRVILLSPDNPAKFIKDVQKKIFASKSV